MIRSSQEGTKPKLQSDCRQSRNQTVAPQLLVLTRLHFKTPPEIRPPKESRGYQGTQQKRVQFFFSANRGFNFFWSSALWGWYPPPWGVTDVKNKPDSKPLESELFFPFTSCRWREIGSEIWIPPRAKCGLFQEGGKICIKAAYSWPRQATVISVWLLQIGRHCSTANNVII